MWDEIVVDVSVDENQNLFSIKDIKENEYKQHKIQTKEDTLEDIFISAIVRNRERERCVGRDNLHSSSYIELLPKHIKSDEN